MRAGHKMLKELCCKHKGRLSNSTLLFMMSMISGAVSPLHMVSMLYNYQGLTKLAHIKGPSIKYHIF
jgi:hypothetical protein